MSGIARRYGNHPSKCRWRGHHRSTLMIDFPRSVSVFGIPGKWNAVSINAEVST
jgi:hypothetical protein